MDYTSLLIIVASLLGVGIIFYIVPKIMQYIKVNNIPINDVLNATKKLSNVVKQLAESNNLEEDPKGVLNIIITSSQLAVKYSEQLYLSGKVASNQRFNEAVKFVKLALTDVNVELTPGRISLIESVVESAVYLLPKTHE